MPSASLVLLIIYPPHEVVILQKFALIQQSLTSGANSSSKTKSLQVLTPFFLY
jgi:hypothetical protein